ncbi:hypothetical protein HHK36_018282 [Tetracentron sinense]|uniref:THO1-MOS11 C-terminal domain-containing protein n=1 Tax=Tetracentron sinense TaxID=13715 RepID=A0A835DAP4_TETSI|nr:hypothetical protein HHK36_018282 [Tetracentron sinense]
MSRKEPHESSSVEASLGSQAPISNLQQKIRRAERFGMPMQLLEEENRNSRAERFGTGSTSRGSDELKKSEEQKREAPGQIGLFLSLYTRGYTFGLPSESGADGEAKKKARLIRFSQVPKTYTVEEDKKKARAIRSSFHNNLHFLIVILVVGSSICVLQCEVDASILLEL